MLEIDGLQAAYGTSQVLFDVSFSVAPGEVATLLGRNGMGKTTTVKSIFGLIAAKEGSIRFQGKPLLGLPSYRIAQTGLGLVPEGRQIFPTLTVEENLIATAASRFGAPAWTLERVYELFPRLAERKHQFGGELSGGEQQMLAIGRALMSSPAYLLLDEPSLGLSPVLTQDLFRTIRKIADRGVGILLVEQNALQSLKIAEQAILIEIGRVVDRGPAAGMRYDPAVIDTYLGGRGKAPAKADP